MKTIYEKVYECPNCGEIFSIFQNARNTANSTCGKRIMSPNLRVSYSYEENGNLYRIIINDGSDVAKFIFVTPEYNPDDYDRKILQLFERIAP
jgi:DNA-directed RNA polymerase subunit RPC12/RpoP